MSNRLYSPKLSEYTKIEGTRFTAKDFCETLDGGQAFRWHRTDQFTDATPEYFGVEYSAKIMGLEMSSAYIASALMPALFGIIGRNISMTLFPFYILLFLVMNIVAIESKKKAKMYFDCRMYCSATW